MEEVWLNKLTSADFLKKLDETFKQEQGEGKVPAVPHRERSHLRGQCRMGASCGLVDGHEISLGVGHLGP